jgi:hypothetical protein
MDDGPLAGHPGKQSRRSDPPLIAKLRDQAALCDQLASEMTFDEHRDALLAMAARWRDAAKSIPTEKGMHGASWAK